MSDATVRCRDCEFLQEWKNPKANISPEVREWIRASEGRRSDPRRDGLRCQHGLLEFGDKTHQEAHQCDYYEVWNPKVKAGLSPLLAEMQKQAKDADRRSNIALGIAVIIGIPSIILGIIGVCNNGGG